MGRKVGLGSAPDNVAGGPRVPLGRQGRGSVTPPEAEERAAEWLPHGGTALVQYPGVYDSVCSVSGDDSDTMTVDGPEWAVSAVPARQAVEAKPSRVAPSLLHAAEPSGVPATHALAELLSAASAFGGGPKGPATAMDVDEQSAVLPAKRPSLVPPAEDPAVVQPRSRHRADPLITYARRCCAAWRPGTAQLLVSGGAVLKQGGVVTAASAAGAEGPLPPESDPGCCTVYTLAPLAGRGGAAAATPVALLYSCSPPRTADGQVCYDVAAKGPQQLKSDLLLRLASALETQRPLPTAVETHSDASALAAAHAAACMRLLRALWGNCDDDDAAPAAATPALFPPSCAATPPPAWVNYMRRRRLTSWLEAAPAGIGVDGAAAAAEHHLRGRRGPATARNPFSELLAVATSDTLSSPHAAVGDELSLSHLQSLVALGSTAAPADPLRDEISSGTAFTAAARHWKQGSAQWRMRLRQHLRSSPHLSVRDAVAQFLAADAGCQPPQREAVAAADTVLRKDICARQDGQLDLGCALLRLWSRGMDAAEDATEAAMLTPLSWDYGRDITANWLVAVLLEGAGVMRLPQTALARQMAAQLEAEGQWQWAVVAALSAPDHDAREAAVRSILQRHLGAGGVPGVAVKGHRQSAPAELQLPATPVSEAGSVLVPAAWLPTPPCPEPLQRTTEHPQSCWSGREAATQMRSA